MLAKYSIRAKITAVVALLLVAMTGMGLLAVRNMRAINASTVDITTNWLPSVRTLGDLRAGVITYRNVIRQHMLSMTTRKSRRWKRPGHRGRRQHENPSAYEAMISSPEERALYNELGSDCGRATRRVPRTSWRCHARIAGEFPYDAQELNTKTVNKIGIEADEILKKDIDLNIAGADNAAQRAADNYASAFDDAGGHPGRCRRRRDCRQLLSGSRRFQRHCCPS